MRPSRERRNERWKGLSRTWFKRELIRRQGLQCNLCGLKQTRKQLVMDHITPWSKGGPTSLDNLQLLCSNCDILKSNS